MDIALVMKPLKQVDQPNSHRDNTLQTEMTVISLEYILDAKSQLLLYDIGLSPDLSEAVYLGKPFEFFIT